LRRRVLAFPNAERLSRAVLGIVLPLALAFTLGVACFVLFTRVLVDIPTAQGPIPFKDVLLTVLAIAAIAISIFGAGVYRLLSQRIETNVSQVADKNLNVTFARLKIDNGFLYWTLYGLSYHVPLADRRHYLDRAIEETKEAYERVITTLDDKELRVEKAMISIRNNWAYFIYEKDSTFGSVSAAEKETARDCVAYITPRKTKYPDLPTAEILDTIQKVTSRF